MGRRCWCGDVVILESLEWVKGMKSRERSIDRDCMPGE